MRDRKVDLRRILIPDDLPDMPTMGTPSVTADERFIVFSAIKPSTFKVFRTDINGNNLVQLTTGDEMDYSPQVINDGRTVLFHRADKASRKTMLMKMTTDGDDLSVIGADVESIQVSPDARSAAFFRKEGGREFLYVAPFDGAALGNPQKLLGAQAGVIRWTPDGKFVTYVPMTGARNLWKVSPTRGAQPIPITNFTSGGITDFQWSRDGVHLYIARTTLRSELILIKDEQTPSH